MLSQEGSITDASLLNALMQGRRAAVKKAKAVDFSKGFALVRMDEGGLLKVPLTPDVKHAIGKFEGKQGSIRRSAKGRTRIMPNGYSRYNHPSTHSATEVVAYVIK